MKATVNAILILDSSGVEFPVSFTVYTDRGDASVGVPPGVDDWSARITGANGVRDFEGWLDALLTDSDRERLTDWLYREVCEQGR